MAFVIPSKHIYNKDNDKLRDNKIDRIEVGSVEVVDTKDNNANVYNNTFDIVTTSIENNASNFYWEAPTIIYNGSVVSTLAYVEYNNHTYTNIEIKIPLLQQNAWIKELNLGKDKDNNSNIQYNVGGYVHKGTVSSNNWSGTIQKSGSKAFISSLTKQSLSYNQTEQGDYQTYQIPKESTSSFIKYDVASGSANAEVSVADGGNLITVKPDTITENGVKYYKLSLKILVGCRIVKITSYNSVPESYSTFVFPISKENFNLGEATYEEYIPDEINLTVYGQTIGINLTDKTIYIPNQSGNKPLFVEGNELMQTNYLVGVPFNVSNLLVKTGSSSGGIKRAWIELANGVATNNKIKIKANIVAEGATTPTSEEFVIYKNNFKSGEKTITVYSTVEIISATIEDNQISESFLKTLSNYSQGKETATIRCAIADYINYISATVVEYIKYDEENRVWCVLDVKTAYLAEKILQAENLKIHDIECIVGDVEDTKIYINFYSLSIVPYLEKGTLTIPLKEIDINNKNGKMAFDIYDEVIPMVYTANQTDKPMSRYKDGSAKTFVVLGTKIYFDGAVWQELTLQEK